MVSSLRVAALSVIAVFTSLNAAELEVGKAQMAHLAALPRGEKLSVESFPIGPARNATVHFQHADVYAPDAHIYVIDAQGQHEIPGSEHVFLRGYSDDGRARIALSLKKDGSFVDGNGSGPDGSFALKAKVDAKGTHHMWALSLEDALPPGYKYDFRCGNEGQSMLVHSQADLMSQGFAGTSSPAVMTSSPSTFRVGTVAVDTDSLFMSQLFSNNTTSAANWIAKMFNTMNTMYEPDLNVVLAQGTTFLRVGSDPYAAANLVPANGTDLDIFGAYWKANYPSVKRSFATLLSGRGPCNSCGAGCVSCSASGIAWIGEYCQNGTTFGSDTVGSYSVVQVFASQTIDPNADIAARLTGHELGHNFGAAHTHCTDKTAGNYFTGTNTIDTCYNGEGASRGCYSGPQTCPAGGAGSIMSYCNIGGCAGTQNLLQFSNIQIHAASPYGLLAQISAAPAGCFVNDEIYQNGFN